MRNKSHFKSLVLFFFVLLGAIFALLIVCCPQNEEDFVYLFPSAIFWLSLLYLYFFCLTLFAYHYVFSVWAKEEE